MQDVNKLKADISRIQLQLYDMQAQLAANSGTLGLQNPTLSSPNTSFHPLPPILPPSAVNQVRNGEWGHSVDTWLNPPPGSPTSDAGKEAFGWYSNLAPFAGQALDFTNSPTNPDNQALKAFLDDGGVHPFYDPLFSDWDRTNGEARLQGTTTIDAPLPNNRLVTPNRAVEYFGCLIARRNTTIRIPDSAHMFVGLWDNTVDAPRPDWIAADEAFAVTAEVRGDPALGTERRYKIFAFTDRGYQYLSTEAVVPLAPSDASFSDSDVYLSWTAIPGILQYAVYRHDIVAGKFRLLRDSLISNTYADNGSVLLDDTGGYPTATNTVPIAYVATREDDLDTVPYDGQPWIVLTLNPAIPKDYNLSTTTGEQVLRIGMTEAMDREMLDAVVNSGDNTIVATSADFTPLDVGRAVTITKDTDTFSTTIASITNDGEAELTAPCTFSAVGASLYIFEGGDHGLLVDAVHISYVSGSAFAPYPDDVNRLQNGGQDPIAAPNHSTQGGAGGGGFIDPGTGGTGGCVTLDTPVMIWEGYRLTSLLYKAISLGESLFSGDLRANYVIRKVQTRTLDLRIVRVRASWLYDVELQCSPTHRVITNNLDQKGKAVDTLRPRDTVLFTINGHVKRGQIREIISTGKAAAVGTFSLYHGHIYCAGQVRYRSWFHRLLGRLLGRLRATPVAGVLSHNIKTDEGFREA